MLGPLGPHAFRKNLRVALTWQRQAHRLIANGGKDAGIGGAEDGIGSIKVLVLALVLPCSKGGAPQHRSRGEER